MARDWFVVTRVLLGALLIVLSGCSPAAPTSPTAAPLPTPTSEHAEAVATLQSGPAPTLRAQAAATSIATSAVQITDASVDQINPENSSVTLSNNGTQAVDLSGWVLLVGSYHITFPTSNYMTLEPARTKIVHLSSSTTPTMGDNLYLGIGSMSVGAGNVTSGDNIILLDAEGHVMSSYPVP